MLWNLKRLIENKVKKKKNVENWKENMMKNCFRGLKNWNFYEMKKIGF